MIYQWKCENEKCGQEKEEMMKLVKYEKVKNSFFCDTCHSPMVPKVTVPNFRLVGGNWERDNYSNAIKNDQKKQIDVYDKHTEAHEKLMRKEERLGEFQ